MNPDNGKGNPWFRIFLMVSGFLVIFLAVIVVLLYRRGDPGEQWIKAAQRHVASAGGENALEPILEGYGLCDWGALEVGGGALRRCALGDASPEDIAQTDRLISRHRGVIAMVVRSAVIPDAIFPPTGGGELLAPRPDHRRFELMGLLLAANARVLHDEGNSEEAAQRLVELLALGARFCRPREEASLHLHVIGLNLMDLGLAVLLPVLRGASFAPGTSAHLAQQLAQVEELRAPVREAFIADADRLTSNLSAWDGTPAVFESALLLHNPGLSAQDARRQARELSAEADALLADYVALWVRIAAVLDRPFHRMPVIDMAWLETQTRNRDVLLLLPEIDGPVVRENLVLARLRMARWFALTAAGGAETGVNPGSLIDPFSGGPFLLGEFGLYSVGPDGKDDGGRVVFDQSWGLRSEGDLLGGLLLGWEVFVSERVPVGDEPR